MAEQHGWVVPRRDGKQAKCGGITICLPCREELQALDLDDLRLIRDLSTNPLERHLAGLLVAESERFEPQRCSGGSDE